MSLLLAGCVTEIVLGESGAEDGGDGDDAGSGTGGVDDVGVDEGGDGDGDGDGDGSGDGDAHGDDVTIQADVQPGFPSRLFIRQWDFAADYCAIVELETPTTSPPTAVEAPPPFGIVSMLALADAGACEGIPGGPLSPVLALAAEGAIEWSDGSPPFGRGDVDCALDVDVRLEFPPGLQIPTSVDLYAIRLRVDGCE